MKILQRSLFSAIAVLASSAMVLAQAPPGGGAGKGPGGPGGGRGRGPARPVLSVTSPAWPDGAEIPMHFAGVGDNSGDSGSCLNAVSAQEPRWRRGPRTF